VHRFAEFDTLCLCFVFLWKIDFKSVYGSSGTKIEISWEHAAYLHFVL